MLKPCMSLMSACASLPAMPIDQETVVYYNRPPPSPPPDDEWNPGMFMVQLPLPLPLLSLALPPQTPSPWRRASIMYCLCKVISCPLLSTCFIDPSSRLAVLALDCPNVNIAGDGAAALLPAARLACSPSWYIGGAGGSSKNGNCCCCCCCTRHCSSDAPKVAPPPLARGN